MGLAEAPPDMMFKGEVPVAKYQHVGESVSSIPIGTLYLTTAALYYYSSWVSAKLCTVFCVLLIRLIV